MTDVVYVIGELNVDLIATSEDIYPEWNKEKIIDSFDLVLGSSSAITACVLAGLGVEVKFVGIVGQDSFGCFCIEQLKERGVDTSYIVTEPSLKTGSTLSLSTKRDRALLTYMGSIPKLTPKHLSDDLFTEAHHIHFGSLYLQREMLPHWADLFKEAKKHGISTSFDTGWDPNDRWETEKVVELLAHTDIFIPSETEIKHIFGTDSLEDVILRLPKRRHHVIVKRGGKGSVLIDNKCNQLHVPAFKVTPIDTTGAGDSFNAGIIYGYLKKMKNKDLLTFANACGALATQRIGGASDIPTKEEVDEFIERQVRKF